MSKVWSQAQKQVWTAAVAAAREVLDAAERPTKGLALDTAETKAAEVLTAGGFADDGVLSVIAASVALADHARARGMVP